MNRRPRADALRLALLGGLLPCAALALESDRNQPIDFEAGHFAGVIAADGDTHFDGGFTLVQGSLRVNSDDAVVTRRASKVVRVQLGGTPATVEQQLDAGGSMHAEARKIDYDIGSDALLLTGNVVITQPEGTLRGERVRYDIGSGRIEGGGDGGRIRMRIEPKPDATGAN